MPVQSQSAERAANEAVFYVPTDFESKPLSLSLPINSLIDARSPFYPHPNTTNNTGATQSNWTRPVGRSSRPVKTYRFPISTNQRFAFRHTEDLHQAPIIAAGSQGITPVISHFSDDVGIHHSMMHSDILSPPPPVCSRHSITGGSCWVQRLQRPAFQPEVPSHLQVECYWYAVSYCLGKWH